MVGKLSGGNFRDRYELPFVHDIAHFMPRMLNSPLSYPEALSDLWMGDQYEGLDNLRDY